MSLNKSMTFILGCLLLSPFILTFGKMVLHDAEKAEREAQAEIEVMEQQQQLEELKDGKDSLDEVAISCTAVGISPQVGLHRSLTRVWSVSPRRWVGVVGLGCCLVILGLWAFSDLYPVTYYSPMLTTKPLEQGSDRAFWSDPATAGKTPKDP